MAGSSSRSRHDENLWLHLHAKLTAMRYARGLRQEDCEADVRDIDELRAKLRSGDSAAAPSGGGRFGWLVLVLVACGIAFSAVYFMPRILALRSSSVVQTLAAVQTPSAVQERGGTAWAAAPHDHG
jgi:hypothetical protein